MLTCLPPGSERARTRTRASLRCIPTPNVAIEELLSGVAKGDRISFERLYDAISDVVFGLARRVVLDADLAMEVAQEVMLEIWRTADRFDPARGSGMGWVAVMTRRRAIDVVRSVSASRRRDDQERPPPESMDPVGEQVVDSYERRQVSAALDGLTEPQREAIDLAFFRGQTHREVANSLGVPLGTVKTRIRDGLLKLAGAMEAGRDE